MAVLTMNSSNYHHRRRRYEGHSKSDFPPLIRYIIAIIFINTTAILFLSLFHLKFDLGSYDDGVHTLSRQISIVESSALDTAGNETVSSSKIITEKCKDHPVWNDNPVWRDAVLRPEICSTVDDHLMSVDERANQQLQLALLNETFYSDHADFTPCGAYCVYHLDSAYSYQYGHPIYGWVLRMQDRKNSENVTNSSTDNKSRQTGCWQPFNSQNEDSGCVVYYYNDWIGYIEDVEATQRKLPVYQKQRSDSDNHINSIVVQQQIDMYQPKCSKVDDDTVPTTPFCHFRSYDGGNSLGIRKKYDFDISSLEFRKNLKPSEIVHLFDRDQLGINDLSEALSFMNETYSNLKTWSCKSNDQPEHLLLCVYHRHSLPRPAAVVGQYGSKVSIKGWQYRTLDRCFIPVENMEYSSACGRSSDQFNIWSKYMLKRQQQISSKSILRVKKPERSNCDRLPLSLGRNVWDHDANKYVYLPPLPTSQPPADGVKYSEPSICGPRILIIGAMKCGTDSIGALLARHPRVKVNRCREKKDQCDTNHFLADTTTIWENHGLSHGYKQDLNNYVAKYAQKLPVTEEYDYSDKRFVNDTSRSGSLTFDLSPTYLNAEVFPNIANRAKQLLPSAKIVISLCHPVQRMYSEYIHTMTYNKHYFELFFNNHNVPFPNNYTELVNYLKYSAEVCYSKPMFCDELRRDILQTGLYVEGIKAWRNAFGVENVVVLDMTESDYDKMKKITSLMGDYLPDQEYPWDQLTNNTSDNLESNEGFHEHHKAFEWLRGYFYRYNVALSKEINAKWPLRWNQKRM